MFIWDFSYTNLLAFDVLLNTTHVERIFLCFDWGDMNGRIPLSMRHSERSMCHVQVFEKSVVVCLEQV